MKPPSQYLPAHRSIHELEPSYLLDCVSYLRNIYTSEVRGSRIISSSQPKELNSNAILRADSFERSYSIRWITSLISRIDSSSNFTEDVINAASALLATISGTAGGGLVPRTFVFYTVLPSTKEQTKLSIPIHDAPSVNNDYASVGAKTWGGACVLSELIASNPTAFGFHPNRKLRVLELGAGTGLVSLAIQQLCWALNVDATVVATDYYPSVLQNLQENIVANDKNLSKQTIVTKAFLDWSSLEQSMRQAELSQPFDLIFGADIIYETEHAKWIRDCVSKLLLKQLYSGGEVSPVFHLAIPLRSTHALESATVEQMFASADHGLGIVSQTVLSCDTEAGDTGTVDYVHYVIGWLQV